MISEIDIKTALKKVDDPELGHNIVDLGLIYGIQVQPETVMITMTLTTPGCPLGPFFIDQVKETVAVAAALSPEDVEVNIVFDPPWSLEAMSPDLRLEMGI